MCPHVDAFALLDKTDEICYTLSIMGRYPLFYPNGGTEMTITPVRQMHTKKQGVLRRTVCAMLAVLLLLTVVPTVATDTVFAAPADNIARLNDWQKIYLQVIKSLAIKDAYDTGILASITAGQAVYESGWARYGISVIANNQYGIKAYSNWDGKVFDYKEYVLYDSYEELVRIKGASYARHGSIWRAYDNWDQSVADHSALFLTERYEDVAKAKDYEEAAKALIAAGYASNDDYVSNLTSIIESYGLDELDKIEADINGVVGLIMNQSKVTVAIGGTLSLTATAYPEPVIYVPPTESEEGESDEESREEEPAPDPIPFEITWESANPDVATVDQNGNVTAVGQGVALITATYNGKVAACAVCVGTNALVFDSDVTVRETPSSSATSLGKINRGMPISVIDSKIYTSSGGTKYYRITGTSSSGKLITGYVLAEYVYLTTREVSVISAKTELNLDAGVDYHIQTEVAPADAYDKTLQWSSSDESIVTVDQEGWITTHKKGTATVRITASSGIYLDITVNVGGTITYTGITTANLYVREEPYMDAPELGLIAEGTKITLFGEPVEGWYAVEATLIDGKTVTGYSYATYIELPSENHPDVDPDPEQKERQGYVHVDAGSSLNLRATAGTKGKKVISIDNGTSVLIIGDDIDVPGEKTYKTWYYIHLYLDGEFYEGYAAADFIQLVEPEPEPEPNLFGDYVVEDFMLVGIRPGTTASQFRKNVNIDVYLYTVEGNKVEDNEAIPTSCEARYFKDGKMQMLTIVVMGDLNCDAKVNTIDYVMAKRHVMGTFYLQGENLRAAMLAGRSSMSTADYVLLKRYVMGTYEL